MTTEQQILVLNAGSTSLKLGLFAADDLAQRADEEVDWSQRDNPAHVSNHEEALHHLLDRIQLDRKSVTAVGHRVVHGGARYTQATRIDPQVKAEIERLAALAPLHNPPALALIAAAEKAFPDIPQIAAFDTAFHRTLPPEQYHFPLPYEWYQDWGIRRFGFHGLSCAWSTERAAAMLGRPAADLRLIICHLGSGCTLCAVRDGQSVATTMGYTPLDGLMMAARPGHLDPGLVLHLITAHHMSADALQDAFERDSGLKGVSGISGDIRDILKAREEGHERAKLAFAMYTARVREGIGAMAAVLGGFDALVFTDGVAENSAPTRAAIATPLNWLGIVLDEDANTQVTPDAEITRVDSRVRVLVIHAREELIVARETYALLGH